MEYLSSMAESTGKQLLSALTEGHEKGNSKSTRKKGNKARENIVSTGRGENKDKSRNHRSVISECQTVTSSKCEFIQLLEETYEILTDLFLAVKNIKSDTSSSSNTTTATSTIVSSSNRTPRKRLLNILLNSTTEEETEEEIPATSTNKKTKRRRRNFSSSTSSSYSSSLATNSTVQSNHAATAASKKTLGEDQNSSTASRDLIAFRTRSRTQSVERGLDIDISKNSQLGQKRKSLQASKSQIQSDSDIEDDSQEEQAHNDKSDKKNSNKKTILKPIRSVGGVGVNSSRKNSEKSNNNKSDSSGNISISIDKKQLLATSRTLRSKTVAVEQSASNLRRKPKSLSASTRVIPKKKRIQTEESGLKNIESSSPNLGAQLARNQGGREPRNTSAQLEGALGNASTSTQQLTGHPPRNLLRRSSRGKGASSSSTTGSCVSLGPLNNRNSSFLIKCNFCIMVL